ncbi:MAG TPA: hypothetical protein VKZ63_16875 [Kofleriaceae bacterium]|nr:hypothetical protein [Kofleriaceae bacterium]
MSPKLELNDKQLDLIDRGLRNAWVMGLGAVALLIGLVLLLSSITPPAMQ